MGFLSNISINRKLIVMQMITFSLVISVCAALYLYFDYTTLRDNKSKNLLVVAQVIGSNAEAPLLFNDSDAANEILNDLKVEPDVTNAWIADTSLTKMGSYTKSGRLDYIFTKIPSQNTKVEVTSEHIYVYYKIFSDKEWLGTVCLRAELTNLKKQFYDKAKLVGFIVITGFLLALLISTISQKYISKPIIKLAGLMEGVNQYMNYKIRSSYDGKDEIGKLSQAFNNMLEKMEKHEQVLSEANSQLESKVEQRTLELKQKNEKLFIANELAQQSKIAKDQFLATMSHEIRTPLNAIIGFQQLLKETSLSAEQKEYVESIDFAGRNLLVIINDILDLSKIEAGKFEINQESLNVEQAVKSVVDLVEFSAKAKKLELVFNHDNSIPESVIGDTARFNQILLNLVGNAVKFTEKGSVTVTSKLISKKEDIVLCEFAVEDTGIGIPTEKLGLVFERFTQASSDTTRKYGGTGLGLTIVQQLLKLQGGNISVKSEEGKGSKFTFYIPFGNAERIIDSHVEQNWSQQTELSQGRKLKILLAEDTPLNQILVKKIVQKWNYEIDVANNGREALDLLEKNNYDIVLMDIQMPEMDGYTATQAIRNMKDAVKKSIPIIALTAHATNEEAQKCLHMGMDAYVTKPFNPGLLLKTIVQLATKRSNQEVIKVEEEIKPSEQLYDLTYLREHAAGDNDFLIEMISIFLGDTPGFLKQLEMDIEEKDYEKIKVTSHSMKGLFLTLGMNDAAQLLKEIENMSISKTLLTVISDHFRKIEAMFFQSKNLLELELKKLQNNS